MIIGVENSFAQHLHVNSQMIDLDDLQNNPTAWSVRVAGEFMIVMNNMLALPVIIRYPQRFNDSRSFMTAFKREFIQLLEISPVPHAKIRLIRDAQFANVVFTQQIQPATQRLLQGYQNKLMGPNATVNWDQDPSNAEIALQLAEQTNVTIADDDGAFVMDLFEEYSIANFHVGAHPYLNEHNRQYLYRSGSINDIMNATAVSQRILDDYERYLEQRNKSENIIDRDLDCAADYLGYCEAMGQSILDDVTLIYHYLINYEKLHDERVSQTYFKEMGYAFREFARFMRTEDLFRHDDFDKFVQATGQGVKDFNSKQRRYHLQRIFRDMQRQVQAQREHALQYMNKRYQVYAELKGYQPTMWRKFTVNGATRLDRLCFAILAAFNADGNHLFELQEGATRYQLPLFDSGFDQDKDMTQIWVGECTSETQFTLTYDFGDMWQFMVKVTEMKPSRLTTYSGPKMIDGYGKEILDDIGGTAGLKQVAKDDPLINQQLNVQSFNTTWPKKIEKIRTCYE